MTDDYTELVNLDEALRYIQTVLEQGKTLGLLASAALKVVGGVYAFAPLRPKEMALPPLTQGGVPESADSYAALVSEIEQYLSEGASKIVIFEDFLASAGDPWLEGSAASGLRVATCGSEIYYLLLAEDVGTKRIAETVAIGSCESYHTVGLFSELASVDLTSPVRLSREDIGAIVKRTSLMVVGAFDGESFLRFHVVLGTLKTDTPSHAS
jgi:hypothetical protein